MGLWVSLFHRYESCCPGQNIFHLIQQDGSCVLNQEGKMEKSLSSRKYQGIDAFIHAPHAIILHLVTITNALTGKW